MLRLHRRPRLLEPESWGARSGRARVLVENPDGVERWAVSRALEDAGYDVRTCAGPAEGEECPLLARGRCPLLDEADVVVSTCRLIRSREILAALSSRPGPRVVFEAPKPELERWAELNRDAVLLGLPATERTIADAVAEAVAAR